MISNLRRYLLPGVIFQSVLIGGGYATGREVVEFGGRFGWAGGWTVAVIAVGFAVSAALTYDLARVFRAYEYKRWIRQLIGGLWPLFDLLFVAMTVLVLGVLSAATGSIAEQVLGWPYWLGSGIVLVLVALLNFHGAQWITRFKTLGTLVLYGGYLALAWSVLSARWGAPAAAPAATASTATILWTGLLYVGYNLAVLPTTLFVIRDHTSRRQAIGAGVVTGVLATVPFALTWLCLLTFEGQAAILEAPVPWLAMLNSVGGGTILVIYGLLVVWTLVETCTGFIHALLDRIDAGLVDLGRKPLSSTAHGVIAAAVVAGAAGLARFGIIDLIAKGYTVMAYGYLLLLALPLVTIGLWRLAAAREVKAPGEHA